jgi:Fe2+ transport system protein FeoA
MGFREGGSFDVISAGGGEYRLCGGIRLTLGRSTAQKITISFA